MSFASIALPNSSVSFIIYALLSFHRELKFTLSLPHYTVAFPKASRTQ